MDLNQIKNTLFGDTSEQESKSIGFQSTVNSIQQTPKLLNSDEVDSLAEKASSIHGVPKSLIRAVIDNESDRTPDGLYIASGKSRVPGHPSSATGLMQLIDSTAKSMGVEDSTDPEQNVLGGTKYLKTLLDKYNGDQDKAVAAYFKGPKTVDDWLKSNPDIRQMPGDLGGTTVKDYLDKINKNYNTSANSIGQQPSNDINNPDYLKNVLFGEETVQDQPQNNNQIGAQQTSRAEPFAMPQGMQQEAPVKEGILPRLGKAWGRSVGSLEGGVGGAMELTHIPGVKDLGKIISEDAKSMQDFYKVDDPKLVDNIAEGVSSGLQFLVPARAIVSGAGTLAMLGNTANAAKIASWLGIGANAVMEAAVEAGNSYNTLQEKGVDDKEATTRALGSFGANLALITATNVVGGAFGRNIDEIKKTIPEMIKAGIKELPKEMLSEGIQEAGQEVISTVAEKEKLNAKDIAMAGGIGALTAGIMHPIGAISENQQRKTEVETPSSVSEKTSPQNFEFVDEKGNVIPGAGRTEPPPVQEPNPLDGAGRIQSIQQEVQPESIAPKEVVATDEQLNTVRDKIKDIGDIEFQGSNAGIEGVNQKTGNPISIPPTFEFKDKISGGNFTLKEEDVTPERIDSIISGLRETIKPEGDVNAEEIRSNAGQVSVGGDVGKGSEDKSSENIQRNEEGLGSKVEQQAQKVTPEKRVDLVTRKKVADMTPEEKTQALLTDDLTGLSNRRAYEEAPKKKIQGIADVDGLKYINDNYGYEAGDALLKAVSTSLKDAGVEAYRIGGDEIRFQHDDEKSIDSQLEKAYNILKDKTIKLIEPDGTVRLWKGMGFSYGQSKLENDDLQSAHSKANEQLHIHKAEREKLGLRAGRAERVPGLSEKITEGDKTGSIVKPVAEVTPLPKEDFKTWHKNQEEKYGIAKGQVVTYGSGDMKRTAKVTSFIKAKEGEAVPRIRLSQKTEGGYTNVTVPVSHINEIKLADKIPEVKSKLEKPVEEIKKEVLSFDRPLEIQKEVEQVNIIPSDAQKEAGNYKKGHIKLSGMDVSIENPAGSERKGKSPEGKEWSSKINHDYGYIRGTKGADAYRGNNSDQLDVFINPGVKEEESRDVFIVNQKDPKTGKFDEHKAMIGFTNKSEAAKAYLSNYEKGWKGMKSIVRMPMDKFKEWAYSDQTQFELKDSGPIEIQKEYEKNIPERSSKTFFDNKYSSGEIVETSYGTKTTAYPDIDVTTPFKAKKSSMNVNVWLRNNAVELAKVRGDKGNVDLWNGINIQHVTPAELDTFEQYLFGKNIESKKTILKPLGKEMSNEKEDSKKTETLLKNTELNPTEIPALKPESLKERAAKRFAEKQAARTSTIPEKIVTEESKRDEALARAQDALKKLGESLVKRNPNTLYSIGTEQAELAFEAVSSLVEAGYREFKVIALKVKELAGAYIDNKNFQNALEDAFDSYQEEESTIPKRNETIESILSQEVKDGNEGRDKTLEKVEPGITEGTDTRASEDKSTPATEEVQRSGIRTDTGGKEPDRSGRTVNGDTISESGGSDGVVAKPRKRDTYRNYIIDDSDNIGSGSLQTKAKNTIDAIRLLKKLESEDRLANKEEQSVLAKFAGWGPLSGALVNEESKVSYTWKEIHKELKSLLSDDEFQAAKEASINAHYTSPKIIRKIWEAVTKMGIKNGNVLEPAVGVGTFFGLRPIKSSFNMVAVEKDSLSARMTKQLYQGADVNHTPYEKYFLPKNYFDLAISNVPFAKIPIFDENAKLYGIKNNQSIHNFFFAKTMHGVRPGGIMAFITSRYTLDAVDNVEVMKAITSKGNIVGAIRLPSDAFKDVANTEVVTDIIFVQKRDEEEPESSKNQVFKEKTKITVKDRLGKDISFNINSYFTQNPDMVIGEHTATGSMYSANEYSVQSKDTFDADLEIAFSSLPKNIAIDYEKKFRESVSNVVSAPKDVTIGSHFIGDDGEIYIKRQSLETPKPVGEKAILSSKDKEVVKDLITLRTQARSLFKKQLSTSDSISEELKIINESYDKFVKKYGFLHDKSNIALINNDTDMAILLAMEEYSKNTKTAKKGDFLLKRIVKEQEAVTKADNVEDAYILSFSEKGRIDFDYMSELSGKSINDIQSELETSGLIYEDPDSFLRGNKPSYIGREEYLSGNVRLKLKQAQEAVSKDQRFTNNVTKLSEVQPDDKGPGEITILPNSPLLTEEDISTFLSEGLFKHEYVSNNIKVRHDRADGKWYVEAPKYDPNNSVTYGVNYSEGKSGVALYGHEILENILNNRPQEVKYTVKTEDSITTVVDTTATSAAKGKESQIKEEFQKWIWTNQARTDRLVKEFNDRFNCYRDRDYTHPKRLKDKNFKVQPLGCTMTLRPHQSNAVWRNIQTNNTLLSHEVGAGKTLACIVTAMEKKRLGLCKKSMIVVPNSLADQWGNDILKAYPGAKILVGNDMNFKSTQRKEFINKAAFGDYDIIVMRYSHFKQISVNPSIEAEYIQERITALNDALDAAMQAGGNKGRRSSATKEEKDLIKKLEKYHAKLDKLLSIKRDVGIPYFDELGVDQIFVDEADNFKNLEYVSSIKKVLGMGNQEGSQQATDLIMKTRFIQKEGGGVVFATGTPIKNSLVEAYHMMRYLQPEYLKDNMLENFDEWQRVFAEPVTSFEQTASGLTQRTRFTKYNNVQELMAALREVWDMVDSQYLEENNILVKGINLPNVKRSVVEINMSPILEDYMDHLAEREREIATRKGPPKKGDDIVPVIMMHGKLAATDIRTINKKAPIETNSKLKKVIDKAYELYTKYPDRTGIIFYDQTAPKKGESKEDRVGIEVLTEIRDRLIFMGADPKEIAMIHEYAKKDLPSLKMQMNNGEKRILLGNTHRMGAGTNVQEKLKWEFHIDAPHRPGDITQREGRIIRQGNNNKEVEIYTFVTKGSFDASAWETLNKKAKMIGSIMNGRDRKTNSFEEEDQFDTASIAALSNPLMMQRAELNQKIKELDGKATNLDTEIYKAKKTLSSSVDELKYLNKHIETSEKLFSNSPVQPDVETVDCTINGKNYTSRKDANEAIKKGIESGSMVLKYGTIEYKFRKEHDNKTDAWFEHTDIHGNKETNTFNKTRLMINVSREYEKIRDSIKNDKESIEYINKRVKVASEKAKESTQPIRDEIATLKTKLADVIKEIEIYNTQKKEEKARRNSEGGAQINWYALEAERKKQDEASDEDLKEDGEETGPVEEEQPSMPIEEEYSEKEPETEQYSVSLSPTPDPMPVKSIIETTKNAPHGKKVTYSVASNKIGKQMSSIKKNRDLKFIDAQNSFYKKVVDLTWPISQIEDQWAEDVGADKEKIRKVDIAISKVRGAGGMAKQFIEDNIEKALNTIPGKIRSKVYTELNKYLIAKRTVWLYENKENYVDAGIDVEMAKTYVEFVEEGSHEFSSDIKRISQLMWDYNRKLLQIKREHGVIDSELMSNLSEPYYVPFYRDIDETTKLNIPKGEKYTNIGKGIKRIQGSETGIAIIEPIQNMMQNTYETFVNAYRSDVMNKIIDFAETSQELGTMFEKVPPKWVKVGTIEYRGEVDLILRPRLKEFANKLGITVEEKPKVAGFIGGKMKKVLGKSYGNKIELMVGATESQFSHELGHQLHKKYRKWVDPFIDSFVDELNDVADTRYIGLKVPASYVSYCRNKDEKFAEFVSMYITDRENLQTIAPNAFMEFETRIALDNNLRELIGFQPSNAVGVQTKLKDNWVQDWHIPQDREVVSVLREGKIVSYKCPVEVADAIKNMHPAMFPTWFRIFTLPMSLLRKGAVTLNIGFIIPNTVRDMQEAAFNARTIPIYDTLIGLKEYLTNGDIYKQFYRLGGGMDSVESGTRQFTKSVQDLKYGNKYGKFLDQMYWKEAGILKGTTEAAWTVLKTPFDIISKLGEASEMASRIGTFRRAQIGMPDWLKWYNNNVYNADEAILIARQATVDFQRFGSYGRTANELIPFINAAIQGYDKMVRTIKDDPKRSLLAAFLYVFAPLMAFWLWNKDKEGYKAVPLQDKINNFIIMDQEGKSWIKIPKGHIVKFIGNPLQVTMEKIYGTVVKSDASIIKQILSDASPIDVSSIPVSLRMIVEPIANYDLYWNREIEKPYHKAILAAGMRYDKKTSEAIKLIGRALNISPIMMQHEVEIVGAGTAKNILWLADIAMGKVDAEKFGLEKMPVTKSFYGKIGDWGTDIDSAIIKINEEISKTRSFSMKKMYNNSGYSPEEIRKIGKANVEKIKLLYSKRSELMKAKEAIKHLRSTEE